MDLHPYLEQCTLPSPKMWHVLATTGDHPALRVGHACIHIPGNGQSNGHLYVTGGANPSGAFSDMFCLDLDTFTWQKYPANGFASRYEHTVFRGQSDLNKFYVFGGADCNGNRNDVQEFDVTNSTWTTLELTGTSPSPRTFHNGACIGDRLIVYSGGERGVEPVVDKNTYAFEIAERRWSVLKLAGDAPKPRHGHLMVAVGNRLFLHGGMSGNLFFDDLHVLDLDRNSWSCGKVKSVKPSRRAAHGGFLSGTDLFVFGGMNCTGALSDMFSLNTVAMQWTAVELCGSAPESRLDFATCTLQLRLPGASSTVSSCVSQSEQIRNALSVSQTTVVQHSESGKDSEAGSILADAAAGDAHIIDVTNEFSGSRDIIDNSIIRSASDTQHSAYREPCPNSPDATFTRQADMQVKELDEAMASVHVEDDATTTDTALHVDVAIVLGGMDTDGEIFDDCLVFRLTA